MTALRKFACATALTFTLIIPTLAEGTMDTPKAAPQSIPQSATPPPEPVGIDPLVKAVLTVITNVLTIL